MGASQRRRSSTRTREIRRETARGSKKPTREKRFMVMIVEIYNPIELGGNETWNPVMEMQKNS